MATNSDVQWVLPILGVTNADWDNVESLIYLWLCVSDMPPQVKILIDEFLYGPAMHHGIVEVVPPRTANNR